MAEAIVHVQNAEHCGKKEAWTQLRKAITDRAVAVRWADVSLTPLDDLPGQYVEEDDVPPTNKWFWMAAFIKFSGGGTILYDPARRPRSVQRKLFLDGELEYRPLLVFREAVHAIWPVAFSTAADVESGGARSVKTADIRTPSSEVARKGGRPTVKFLVSNTLSRMRDEGCSLNRTQKVLASEIAGRNGKEIGAKGWHERTVFTHISNWLKENGFTPANPSPRE